MCPNAYDFYSIKNPEIRIITLIYLFQWMFQALPAPWNDMTVGPYHRAPRNTPSIQIYDVPSTSSLGPSPRHIPIDDGSLFSLGLQYHSEKLKNCNLLMETIVSRSFRRFF